jgi:hypothetical protein
VTFVVVMTVNFELSLEPSSSSLFSPLSTRDPITKGVCQGDYCIWLGTLKSLNSVCVTAEQYYSMKGFNFKELRYTRHKLSHAIQVNFL